MSSKLAVAVAATVLMSCAGASAASAADLYVSPTGVDSGTCQSASSPCATIAYADGQTRSTPGGDTVTLAAGDYASAVTLIGSNVTWQGPQAGVPAPGRTGSEARIVVPESDSGFQALGTGIVLDGLTFQSSGGNGAYGLNLFQPMTVRNVRFTNLVTGVASSGGVTIQGSDFNTSNAGVLLSGSGGTVTTSTFRVGGGASGIFHTGGALVATGDSFLQGTYGIQSAAGTVAAAGNRFAGPGMYVSTAGTDATNNWWGCNGGAGASGCASLAGPGAGTATFMPYLTLTGSVVPSAVATDDAAEVRATLRINSAGQDVGLVLRGTPIAFATDGGTLSEPTVAIGADGLARDTLTAPATPGTVTPSVTLDNATVPLSLEVLPDLSITPGEEDFGSAYVGGSTSPRPFTVTNNTSGPITISGVGLQGPDTDNFVVYGQGCRTTLAAGASCTVSAALRPVSEGGKVAQLGVIPAGSPTAFTADLSGGGVVDDTIDINQTTLTFGAISVGGASPRQNVTVTNTGTNPLPITAITTGGDATDFTVSAGACRITLSPGQSCTFSAAFRPDGAEGPRNATVTLRFDGHPARTVSLVGSAVASALTISPEGATFGSVRVGQSSSKRTFTITNNGATGDPVFLRGISLGGADPGSYALYASGCANRGLLPGDSCQISAFLRPTTPGTKRATITVGAESQPARTIELTGSGTA